MTTYFVTGGTGVVGSGIISRLMTKPDSEVVALVRATDPDNLRQRVDELRGYCDPDGTGRPAALRGETGDATAVRFGLPEEIYRTMAQRCQRVIHCAGAVRMNLPIAQARASAVDSTGHILAFMRDCAEAQGQYPKLEFVSTVGVAGRSGVPLVEQWQHGHRVFHNTYEQSKAEAEALVERAVGEGMPITVHRPSMVVGDSRTGRVRSFQVFYHLVEFLSGSRTLGLFPDPERAVLDLIPADVVANCVVGSSDESGWSGKILHLCSGSGGAIPIRALMDEVQTRYAARGLPTKHLAVVPTWVLSAILPALTKLSSGKTRRALQALPVFLDYLASEQNFVNDETVSLIAGKGISIPPIRDYLGAILDFYLDSRCTRVVPTRTS